jgi:hypothetical protein
MHTAPPVRMSLVADSGWQAFSTLAAAIAAANFAAWLSQHARWPAAVTAVAAIAAALVAAVCAHAGLRRVISGGVLAWDSAQWSWAAGEEPPCAGNARVMLDLDAWLLLRFEPAAPRPARWLVATRGMAGAAWPAWRAALYSRRPRREPTAV